jgi:hypothetical protein
MLTFLNTKPLQLPEKWLKNIKMCTTEAPKYTKLTSFS